MSLRIKCFASGKRGCLEKAVETRRELTTGRWEHSMVLQGSSKDKFFVLGFLGFFFLTANFFPFSFTWDCMRQACQTPGVIPGLLQTVTIFLPLNSQSKASISTSQQLFTKADLEIKNWTDYTAQTEKATKKTPAWQCCSPMCRILLCVQITRVFVANYSTSSQDPSTRSLPASPSPTWNGNSSPANLLTCWWPRHVPRSPLLCPHHGFKEHWPPLFSSFQP